MVGTAFSNCLGEPIIFRVLPPALFGPSNKCFNSSGGAILKLSRFASFISVTKCSTCFFFSTIAASKAATCNQLLIQSNNKVFNWSPLFLECPQLNDANLCFVSPHLYLFAVFPFQQANFFLFASWSHSFLSVLFAPFVILPLAT